MVGDRNARRIIGKKLKIQSEARRGTARYGQVRRGRAWLGEVRLGLFVIIVFKIEVWRGLVRYGPAGCGEAW